jgi:hypothetical protein
VYICNDGTFYLGRLRSLSSSSAWDILLYLPQLSRLVYLQKNAEKEVEFRLFQESREEVFALNVADMSVDIPKKYKAAVYDKPGSISTKIEELDMPEPGPGEVLINL